MPPINASDRDSVSVGWVLGLHGTSGELRVRVFSDVSSRFSPGQSLDCNGSTHQIAAARRSRSNQVILKLAGVDSPRTAQELVGHWLTASPETSPQLPEGEYFHYQLIGLRVVTEDGEDLGNIAEIIATGSNDVYVMSGAEGELLVPAISQVIRNVDLANGQMTVRLLEGLR